LEFPTAPHYNETEKSIDCQRLCDAPPCQRQLRFKIQPSAVSAQMCGRWQPP